MLSPLEPLVGVPALDVNTLLRVLILFKHSKDKGFVKRGVERWAVSSTSSRGAMASMFCFSMEFLYRMHLIDQHANPIGLSGLVAHNFDIYPINFALAYLVLVGALDTLLLGFDKSAIHKRKCLIDLIMVIAYLVGRVSLADGVGKSLTPLPNDVKHALNEYNKLCACCALDCATCMTDCEELPIPEVDITPEGALNSYAVDFYLHGNIRNLVQDNNMTDNFAYRHLKIFDSALSKLATMAKAGARMRTNVFARAITCLALEFNQAFHSVTY